MDRGTYHAVGRMNHESSDHLPAEMSAPSVRPPYAVRPMVALVLGVLVLHFVANALSPYGVHRDEFLYLAMGRHLRIWRMDFPPFIALLAQTTRALLGDSLPALRAGPSLAAAALVALAGGLAREFGGGRTSQVLAGVAMLASPLFMRAGNLYQPVVFDQLWWTLALFALARIGRAEAGTGSWRGWVLLGVAGGVGLLTKFSILFLGCAVLVGLVASPLRRSLATPWPWVAVALALILGSPSVVGQMQLGFPVAGQMHDLQAVQLSRVSYLDFLGGQLLMFGPLLLLAVPGELALLFRPAWRRFRVVGWTCLTAFLLLMVLHGKAYYIGPIYPALFGAGAVVLEDWTRRIAERGGRPRAWLARGVRRIAFAVVAVMALVMLPLGLPILPPPDMARYAQRLGVTAATTTNTGQVLALPQDYADMLGWPELVAATARVYNALPPDQRRRAVVLADNYGEAGALDFYGPHVGLPPVICPVGSYWFFGPGTLPGEILVTVGVKPEGLRDYYQTVTLATRVRNSWGVPEEQDVPIVVARGPFHTLQEVWPSLAGRN